MRKDVKEVLAKILKDNYKPTDKEYKICIEDITNMAGPVFCDIATNIIDRDKINQEEILTMACIDPIIRLAMFYEHKDIDVTAYTVSSNNVTKVLIDAVQYLDDSKAMLSPLLPLITTAIIDMAEKYAPETYNMLVDKGEENGTYN